MAKRDDGLLLVNATVQGDHVHAMIDTGAPYILISPRLAARLGRHVRPLGTARSVGGAQELGTIEDVAITVGSQVFHEGTVEVGSFDSVERELGASVDLVIGSSLITRTGLQVDNDNARISLSPPPAREDFYGSIPIRFDAVRSEFVTKVSLFDKVVEPILIDTGSDADLTIVEAAFSGPRPTGHSDMAVVGGGGQQVEEVFTAPEIALGETKMQDVVTQIEPRGSLLDDRHLAGALGTGALTKFNYAINPMDGRLLLWKRRRPAVPTPKSTIGVQGELKGDRIRIAHIMANSPAAKAGLRVGDEICAVDGTRIASNWHQTPAAKWSIGPIGQRHQVSLCSGRRVDLTSAAFY